jgi:hypothetical protein
MRGGANCPVPNPSPFPLTPLAREITIILVVKRPPYVIWLAFFPPSGRTSTRRRACSLLARRLNHCVETDCASGHGTR